MLLFTWRWVGVILKLLRGPSLHEHKVIVLIRIVINYSFYWLIDKFVAWWALNDPGNHFVIDNLLCRISILHEIRGAALIEGYCEIIIFSLSWLSIVICLHLIHSYYWGVISSRIIMHARFSLQLSVRSSLSTLLISSSRSTLLKPLSVFSIESLHGALRNPHDYIRLFHFGKLLFKSGL